MNPTKPTLILTQKQKPVLELTPKKTVLVPGQYVQNNPATTKKIALANNMK